MRLAVLQKDFQKALVTSSRFVSTRAQLPVLSNILLQAKGAKLTLTATNLELSITTSVGAKVEEDGEIAVPARAVTDLVSSLADEHIDLSSKGEELDVETAKFSGKLLGMNTSDFPQTLREGSEGLRVKPELLQSALREVLFATSSDDTRPVLTGVLFMANDERLTLVSSDGVRLSQKHMPVKGSLSEENLIVPKNVLVEVMKIFSGDSDVSISYSSDNSQIVFVQEETVVVSRVIEGEYPNFEKIIPKNPIAVCRVNREEFLGGIRTASVFARDASSIIVLSVGKGEMTISSESQTVGSQSLRVDASLEGEPVSLSYNYKYIEEFLNCLKGEEITMEFTNGTTAGIFKDSSDDSLLHLIMPVKS